MGLRDAGGAELLFRPATHNGLGALFQSIRLEELDAQEPIRVPEGARFLVFLQGDQEVRRVDLPECRPGETRTIP